MEGGLTPSASHDVILLLRGPRITHHYSFVLRDGDPVGLRDRFRYRRTPELHTLVSHLAIDHDAPSADPGKPAFMAPPPGSLPYHGFQVLEQVDVDGFRWGAITALGAVAPATIDGFIVAPDGSRAGVEWRRSSEPYVLMLAEPTAERWGVWRIGFTDDIVNEASATRALRAVISDLQLRWEQWRAATP